MNFHIYVTLYQSTTAAASLSTATLPTTITATTVAAATISAAVATAAFTGTTAYHYLPLPPITGCVVN